MKECTKFKNTAIRNKKAGEFGMTMCGNKKRKRIVSKQVRREGEKDLNKEN
ncbi:MAG: hypothetical protein FWD89_04535 [Firmicutes bacterium]|nr:hypothetical protein [Bacillota bacterium]MCL2771550.1 hypothetical protein [Bacillota bacterium]